MDLASTWCGGSSEVAVKPHFKKKNKKKHMHSLRFEQLKVTLTGRPLLLGDDIMRWCNLIAH